EATDSSLRIRLNEQVMRRPLVATTIVNGDFTSNLDGWTNADEAGAVSAQADGCLSLKGTRFNAARRRQQVTVSGADQDQEHGLRIVIARGRVSVRVGSSAGADDYVEETTLRRGVHSIALKPADDFWIEFANREQPASLVDSVAIEPDGPVDLATPWPEAK